MMQLMTHVVLGYPNSHETERIIASLVAGGSEIIELQIPFSDPVADGPTIARANDVALAQGVDITKALKFAAKVAKKYPKTRFYFMSYLNPVLAAGGTKFFARAARAGIQGFIIPDLPVEEAGDFLFTAEQHGLDLIFVLAPNTTVIRIRKIVRSARGFLYCIARLGVTGGQTSFTTDLRKFLTRVKKYTQLPLAVGFGVEKSSDISAISKAGGEIAVSGSAIIRAHEKGGVKAVKRLIRHLKFNT